MTRALSLRQTLPRVVSVTRISISPRLFALTLGMASCASCPFGCMIAFRELIVCRDIKETVAPESRVIGKITPPCCEDTDNCALGTGAIVPRETSGHVSWLFID